MILNSTSDVKVLSEGQTKESIGMQLDLESAHILMTMLSKNLYSDSIGSTIRETTSNALDSHRRAGVESPIIVSFGVNSSNNYEFIVEDFGTGLDDKDVAEIISKYGKSTKRDSNSEIGCFGLGFKAPLSYASSFIFICRKDAWERKYMMCEGEKGNTIELLFESVTAEPNGVKIIVPVQYKDKNVFVEKIHEQLAYFENVYFNVNGVDNEFHILRETDFQVSELSNDHNMHICLDNVYYPIDWGKLGINCIPLKIGLRFSLNDGLVPTPSRENLIYTDQTKKVIISKIERVADWFMLKHNEVVLETEDPKVIFHYLSSKSHTVMINNTPFILDGLEKFTEIEPVPPTLKGVEKLNLRTLYGIKDALTAEYKVTHRLSNYTINHIKHSGYSGHLAERNFPMKNLYVYKDEIPFLKKEFMKDLTHGNETFFVKKIYRYRLFKKSIGCESLYTLLGLRMKPKSDWRQIIKEFQYVQEKYTNQFHNLDNIDITPEWLEDRKNNRNYNHVGNKALPKGEIHCKIAKPLERYNGDRHCKFEAATLKLEDFSKHSCLHLYAKYDDTLLLDGLYNTDSKPYIVTKGNNLWKLRLFTVSPTEYKKLESISIHNLMSYEKFMEGNNKVFKRIVTSQLIHNLVYKHKSVFDYLICVKLLSNDLFNRMNSLQVYKNQNFYSIKSEAVEAMIQVAEEHNLFDMEFYNEYLEIKDLLENKLYFLNPIIGKIGYYNDYSKHELFPILVDLCKFHKFKLNLEHYVIPLPPESEPVTTDEDIQDITSV